MHSSLYSATFDDARRTLCVSGLIDELVVDQLRTDIAEHSGGHATSIRVDLSDVAFLPSIAIGVLITSQRKARANGCHIALCAAEGSLAARILSMVALPFEAPGRAS